MRQDGDPTPRRLQGPVRLSAFSELQASVRQVGTTPKTAEGARELYDNWAGSYDAALSSLSPAERRSAHDLVVGLQDQLVALLSALVAGMALDGADLIDDRGVPRDYSAGDDPISE